MQAAVRFIFFFTLLILHQISALAHSGDATGFASIQVQGQIVRYTLTPAPTLKIDAAKLADTINKKITVTADSKPCPAARNTGLTQDFHCDHAPLELSVRDDCVDTLGASHHVIALITWQGGSQSFSFADQTRVAVIAIKPATSTTSTDNASMSVGSFFFLGVEHIVTGYDHLLFLLALILCGGNLIQLLKIITAFTLAHSITLAAAALNIITLPSVLVEAVIALSIAYVAFENLYPRYAISKRWTISFVFGLMHGFGFSTVLRDIGLPQDNLIWSLLNFNLGVEAGQLAAVVLVLPALFWLRKTVLEAKVVRVVSAVVMGVGIALFIERIV
ncbi:MAG: HupE/UreJ family protein [Burkholderiales bacterium]|nr:HupE/UreJ family protein [Burkholderiales bacterium]